MGWDSTIKLQGGAECGKDQCQTVSGLVSLHGQATPTRSHTPQSSIGACVCSGGSFRPSETSFSVPSPTAHFYGVKKTRPRALGVSVGSRSKSLAPPHQHPTYIPIVRDNLGNIQHQLLESCKSTFLQTLNVSCHDTHILYRDRVTITECNV